MGQHHLFLIVLLVFACSVVSINETKLSDCYRRNGFWTLNETPRFLPWIRKLYGRPTICDAEFGLGEMQGYEADSVAAMYLSRGNAAQSLLVKDLWNVSSTQKWTFEMKDCTWQEFTYPHFCKALRHRFKTGHGTNFLFVGGDLMYGLERRIAYNMLSSKNGRKVLLNLFPEGCVEPSKDVDGCIGFRYCLDDDNIDGNFSVGLRYIRNVNVSLTRSFGLSSDERAWAFVMDVLPTEVLVFNFQTAELITYGQFASVFQTAILRAKKRNPNITVLYVSTPILHNCPLKAPNAPNASLSSLDPRDIKNQNLWAEKLVTSLGGVYVDLNAAIESQPPALFRDLKETYGSACAPLCQPGIMDSWAAILYNVMLDALGAVPTASPAASESGQLHNVALSPSDYDANIEDQYERPPVEVPVLTSPIPGSRLRSEREVERVRAKLDCFSNKGRWMYNATPRALPWTFEEINPALCDKRYGMKGGMHEKAADMAAANGSQWAVREAVKWQWESECPMEPFSLETFCRAVGSGGRILFLGDSITDHFMWALMNNIVMESRDGVKSLEKLLPDRKVIWNSLIRPQAAVGYAICHDFVDEPVTISYYASHRLTLTKWPRFFEVPWVRKLKEWNPTIVVLNRGVWGQEPNTTFRGDVQNILWYIRQQLPNALIIWRNTPKGHSNCSDHKAALEHPEIETYWLWRKFTKENEIAAQLIREVGGVLLDVEYMTALRPDGHIEVNVRGNVDCIHYCQPGPQDAWVQLLFNTFRTIL